ncbi:MAG: hypothetical protein JSU00_22585 [Acidobacteria bacterium]|nr:hypothetical protein [Acidobacteriota bacterium]
MDLNTLNARVWEEMVYAYMRTHYFAALVAKYQQYDKWFRVAGFVLSSGSIASALFAADPMVRASVPIVATAVSAWLLFSQYSTVSRDASELMTQWQDIATKYEKLWNHLDDDDAETQFDAIYQSANLLSKPGSKFPEDKKLLNEWMDRQSEILTSRYSPVTHAGS